MWERIYHKVISLAIILPYVGLLFISLQRKSYYFEYLEKFGVREITYIFAIFAISLFVYGYFYFRPRESERFFAKNFLVIWIVLLIALITPTFFSKDIFSYLIVAKNTAIYHINPYFISIGGNPDNPWTKFIGDMWWKDIASPYGPLFQLFVIPFGFLATKSLLAAAYVYKIVNLFLFALIVLTLREIIRIQKMDNASVALFAINPAIVINLVMEAHNETLMLLLVSLALLYAIRNEYVSGLAAFGGAIAIKYYPIIILPVFWFKKGIPLKTAIAASFLVLPGIFMLVSSFFDLKAIAIFKSVFTENSHCMYSCAPFNALLLNLFGQRAEGVKLVLFIVFFAVIFMLYRILLPSWPKFFFWTLFVFLFLLINPVTPWVLSILIFAGMLNYDRPIYRYLTFGITFYSLFHYFGL